MVGEGKTYLLKIVKESPDSNSSQSKYCIYIYTCTYVYVNIYIYHASNLDLAIKTLQGIAVSFDVAEATEASHMNGDQIYEHFC